MEALWLSWIVNGSSYGIFLFVLASGLTLVLGTMGVLNLAHGSMYLLGVNVAFTVTKLSHNFLLGLLAGGCAMGILAILTQRFLISAVPKSHLPQMLVTFGLIYIIAQVSLIVWGGYPIVLPKPSFLNGSLQIGHFIFAAYRLALIFVGLIFAAFLWLFIEKTKWGAIIRAGRDDAEMAEGIGLNIRWTWVVVFGLGGFMAGVAGAIGGPFLGAYPGVEWDVLLPAFVVVVIGGMGSLKGAFLASIFIGILDNVGRSLLPELAAFLLFLPMVIVLVIRPSGLFGRKA